MGKRKAASGRITVSRSGLTGVGERGMQAQGSSWNLGGPVISTRDAGWGNPVTNPWPIVDCVRSIMGAKKRAPGVVSEVEGNEDQGEGWQGVEAFHITVELGEPALGDPGEGRGRRIMEPLEGKMAGTSSPENVSTKLQRVAKLSREAPDMIWTTLAHLIDCANRQILTKKKREKGVTLRSEFPYGNERSETHEKETKRSAYWQTQKAIDPALYARVQIEGGAASC